MHENYGWTRQQIDGESFEYILDLLVARAKTLVKPEDKPKKPVFADQSLF